VLAGLLAYKRNGAVLGDIVDDIIETVGFRIIEREVVGPVNSNSRVKYPSLIKSGQM